VGMEGCGRDGTKENLNKFHKMAERLVGLLEEMTMGVKRLYQMINYGWRRSLQPRQVLLRPF
jgi:S-adenosylhomocysteine hydrolase